MKRLAGSLLTIRTHDNYKCGDMDNSSHDHSLLTLSDLHKVTMCMRCHSSIKVDS